MQETLTSHPAVAGCLASVERCLAFLDHLTQDLYVKPAAHNSPIGSHMRHCVDHFLCFFKGWEERLVDYDARDRDQRLETDLAHCRSVLESIHFKVADLDSLDPRTTLRIQTAPAPGVAPSPVPSCLERELLFLSSHTIHHIAIMKLIAEQIGIAIPEDIGVAYSTASYRARLAHRG